LVREFTATLKPREAQIYRLRFEQGQDHKAIADETGLSPSKIKTSEKRIRTGFFDFMKRRGYFGAYAQSSSGWLRALRRRQGA
jgi:DNA-directed RNA polymerase specialized sigma24 family protein